MTNLVGTVGAGATQYYQNQQNQDYYKKQLAQQQASGGVTSLANPYQGNSGSYGGYAQTDSGFASGYQPQYYDDSFNMGSFGS